VRHHHHRHALARQRLDHVEHLAHELDVERGRRLVEQHRFRPHHEGARDRDTLLLAARELVRELRALLGEANSVEERPRLLTRFTLVEPPHLDEPAHHVVERRHVLKQVEPLEDHPDLAGAGRRIAEHHGAAVRLLEQSEAAQQRRLARAGRPDDRLHLPGLDLERDVVQHLEVAV